MRPVILFLAIGIAAGCSGCREPAPSDQDLASAAAMAERAAARRELAELSGGDRTPMSALRRWQARARLERAVLDLDAQQRGALEERAGAIREARASGASAWEEIDLALERASSALRLGDRVAADSSYALASRLLDAWTPTAVPEPRPPLLAIDVRGTRALRAERVRIGERLAWLAERRIEISGTVARLEEDGSRLAGLRRFRGVLDRSGGGPDGLPVVHESPAERVLDARVDALRAEEKRGNEEEAALRSAIEQIDRAVAAGAEPAPGLPPEER